MSDRTRTVDDGLILDGDGFAETETGYITRPGDYARPYDYSDWVKRVAGLKSEDSYEKYHEYIASWTENKQKAATISDTIYSDYLNFVKSIAIYIDGEEREKFIKDVNWNSKLDLERLIPRFASKLRDIIRYFADKRESVIRSKLKYNMHGAFISIERMLHEYLLANFTKRKHYVQTTNKDLLQSVPDLYDINTRLVIGMKEGYDDQNYFDKNPEFGAKKYFDDVIAGKTKLYGDWETSGANDVVWLFDGGLNERKLDNPIFYTVRDAVLGTSGLSGYEEDIKINEYLYDLTKKYLGNDLSFLNGGYFVNDIKTYEYNFKVGNNWFYFPSGEMAYEAEDIELEAVPINETTLSSVAHGASSYDEADRLFIRHDDGTLEGAWLRKEHFETKTISMSAQIQKAQAYPFHFPFPGYGVSGDEIPWSGPKYHNFDPEYYALQDPQRREVQKLYWESDRPDFDATPINIQKLSVATYDGLSGSTFENALHLGVRRWTDSRKDAVYTGDIEPYWLYGPTHTDLVVDECRNYFEFPHFKHQSARKEPSLSGVWWTDTVVLKNSDPRKTFLGAVAGNCPSESDIIYKVDSNGIPFEAAWLSGGNVDFVILNYELPNQRSEPFDKYSASGLCYQPGFNPVFEQGEDTYFVWTGHSKPMDEVFPARDGEEKFSPVASGSGVKDFDFCCEASDYPIIKSPEEIRNTTKSGEYVGWYAYYSGVENKWCIDTKNSDMSGKVPHLRPCTLYRYHRAAGSKKYYVLSSSNLFDSEPNTIPKWMAMIKTDSGWVASNKLSNMYIRNGDLIVYDHLQTRKFSAMIGVSNQTGEMKKEDISTPIGPFSIKFDLPNARPYFTKGQNEDEESTGKKSVDVYGSTVHEVGNVMVENPDVADIDINPWDILTVYSPKKSIVWTQNVKVKEPKDVFTWCKLSVEMDSSDFYPNRKDKIVAVPRMTPSDIVFSFIPGDKTLINYWANYAFTWEQPFRNVKDGVPPTGGKYINDEIIEGIEAMYPYANMSNRHYPTMALAQDMSKFYTKETFGGYFVPKYLGVTEAITKDPTIEVVASGRSESDPISVISVADKFAQDSGFTKGIENKGLHVKHESLDWMKTPITIGSNTGMRFDEPAVQTFVPYITEEETRAKFNKGIERADDYDEPWLRNEESEWDINGAATGYNIHRTRQEPISKWADDRFAKRTVTKVKSDIYGTQFELVKKTEDSDSIYDERRRTGELFFRSFDGRYRTMDDMSAHLYLYPPIRFGWIVDFDVAYNMFYCVGKFPFAPKTVLFSRAVSAPYSSDVDIAELEAEIYDRYIEILGRIRSHFKTYSDVYGIGQFSLVGQNAGKCVKTMRSIYQDAMALMRDIDENYLVVTEKSTSIPDFIRTLNASDVRYAMASIDPRPENFINSLNAVCDVLKNSVPFVDGGTALFAFPILIRDRNGVPSVTTSVGDFFYRLIENDVKVSRPWFLQEKRKYIVPMVHNYAGRLVPEFVTIDIPTMSVETVVNDSLDDVTASLTSAIHETISLNNMIDPLCAFNDKTNKVILAQQVSGEESQVGAFGMYEYNILDSDITGYSIVPVDNTDELEAFDRRRIITHRPEEEAPSGNMDVVHINYYDNLNDEGEEDVILLASRGCLKGSLPVAMKIPLNHACYYFDGLSWGFADGTPFNFKVPLEENVDLYPRWTTVPVTISFDPDNGDDIEYRFADCNGVVGGWPSNPVKEFREFDRWVDDNGITVRSTDRFVRETRLHAIYKDAVEYHVVVKTNLMDDEVCSMTVTAGNSLGTEGKDFISGKLREMEDNPQYRSLFANMKFSYWYTEDGFIQIPDLAGYVPKEDVTIVAGYVREVPKEIVMRMVYSIDESIPSPPKPEEYEEATSIVETRSDYIISVMMSSPDTVFDGFGYQEDDDDDYSDFYWMIGNDVVEIGDSYAFSASSPYAEKTTESGKDVYTFRVVLKKRE